MPEAVKIFQEEKKQREAAKEEGGGTGGGASRDLEKQADPEKKVKRKSTSQSAADAAPTTDQGATTHKGKGKKYKMGGFANMLLTMENPTYHAACFSIYSFEEDLPLKSLVQFFNVLCAAYPKYRYRVVGNGKKWSGASWEEIENFNPKSNIKEARLRDGHNGQKEIFGVAGDFLAAHFDYKLPIWEALLVHNVGMDDGTKCVLMIKVHHAFSDGQGMIMSYHTALQSLAHKEDVSAIQRQLDKHAKPNPRFSLGTGTIKHFWHAYFGTFWPTARTSFRYADGKRIGKRSEGRLYAHSEGIPLKDIKVIREAFKDVKDITLNDVACALITRAARRCAERRSAQSGIKIKEKKFCLLVPVSLRPKGNWELENWSTGSLAWFDFRSEKELSLKDQILQANKEMNIIKKSRLHDIGFWTFDWWFKRPIWYFPEWTICKRMFHKAFAEYHIATNVPGPPKPVAFAGVEAKSYHVLPPSSPARATMAIGMISYADYFSIAVSCDEVPEFADLPEGLCQAFEQVAAECVAEAKKMLEAKKGS